MFGLKGGMSIVTRGTSTCSYLTSVDVSFGWDEMRVLVPSEYPRGSCEYRAVIDHENQHVSIIRSALREFAPVARRRLESVIAGIRPMQGKGDALLEQALSPVRSQLSVMLNEFNTLHGARGARIDTPSNYRAVTPLCKNWDGLQK